MFSGKLRNLSLTKTLQHKGSDTALAASSGLYQCHTSKPGFHSALNLCIPPCELVRT